MKEEKEKSKKERSSNTKRTGKAEQERDEVEMRR